MLLDILQKRKCFKLILGAGNSDLISIERLIYLYAKAGANFFDVGADINTVNVAKEAIKKANPKQQCYICASVGLKGDPHINKVQIKPDKCLKCELCKNICPQKAIEDFNINSKKCIGCSRCKEICPNKAIDILSEPKDLSLILPPILDKIDCIEFHIINSNKNDIINSWNKINSIYNGVLSICLDRSNIGNIQFTDKIKKLIKDKKPYTTIVQADGAPMSGGCDDFKTTLQAVSAAQIVQNANLDCYIIASGGTNSKTSKLAKMCGVSLHGVAVGSYARKIVQDFIEQDDFMKNKEQFNKALVIAKNLVDECLKYLK